MSKKFFCLQQLPQLVNKINLRYFLVEGQGGGGGD